MLIKILLIILLLAPVSQAKELPKQIKDWITEHGITLPFKGEFSYSNKKVDKWLRIRKKDGIYKVTRDTKDKVYLVKEKELTDIRKKTIK